MVEEFEHYYYRSGPGARGLDTYFSDLVCLSQLMGWVSSAQLFVLAVNVNYHVFQTPLGLYCRRLYLIASPFANTILIYYNQGLRRWRQLGSDLPVWQ